MEDEEPKEPESPIIEEPIVEESTEPSTDPKQESVSFNAVVEETEIAAEEEVNLDKIGTGISMLPSDFVMKPKIDDVIEVIKREEDATVADDDDQPRKVVEMASEVVLSRSKMKLQQEIAARKEEMEKRKADRQSSLEDDLVGLEEEDEVASYATYHFEEEVEEESEEILEEEEQESVFLRDAYYEIYDNVKPIFAKMKIRNNYLHRKMAEYYRGRKMEHVLKETDHQADTLQRYNQRLDHLGTLKETDKQQRDTIGSELRSLRELKQQNLQDVTGQFNKLQAREAEVGTGLKFSKSGKELTPQHLNRLLNRQTKAAKNVTDLRRLYVKYRDRVSEKTRALQDLETIADGLHLYEYEEMKLENQSYIDRIEERDKDLSNFRLRCSTVCQVLAHYREKVAASMVEVERLYGTLEDVEAQKASQRETLNEAKSRRDFYRGNAFKMEESAGLLTHSGLLRDMEESMESVQEMYAEIWHLKKRYGQQKEMLTAIRSRLEGTPKDGRIEVKKKKKIGTPEFYKGSPSMLLPTIPKSIFGYHPVYARSYTNLAVFPKSIHWSGVNLADLQPPSKTQVRLVGMNPEMAKSHEELLRVHEELLSSRTLITAPSIDDYRTKSSVTQMSLNYLTKSELQLFPSRSNVRVPNLGQIKAMRQRVPMERYGYSSNVMKKASSSQMKTDNRSNIMLANLNTALERSQNVLKRYSLGKTSSSQTAW